MVVAVTIMRNTGPCVDGLENNIQENGNSKCCSSPRWWKHHPSLKLTHDRKFDAGMSVDRYNIFSVDLLQWLVRNDALRWSLWFRLKYVNSSMRHNICCSFAHAPHHHPASWPLWVGSTHFDEIPYVFGAPLLHSAKYTIAERDFSASVMDAWTSFAKTGLVQTR